MIEINIRQLCLLRTRLKQHLDHSEFFSHEQRIKFADSVSTSLSGCEGEEQTIEIFEYLNELDDFLDCLNDMGGKFLFKDDGTIDKLVPVSKEEYRGILERCLERLDNALPKNEWELDEPKVSKP